MSLLLVGYFFVIFVLFYFVVPITGQIRLLFYFLFYFLVPITGQIRLLLFFCALFCSPYYSSAMFIFSLVILLFSLLNFSPLLLVRYVYFLMRYILFYFLVPITGHLCFFLNIFLFFVSSYYWSDIFIFYFVIFCFCFQSLLLVNFVYVLFCYFLFYFVVATNGQILFFSPYYWSDMFTVLVNMSRSMQICEDWNINDMTIQTMHHENVTSCPCSLDVALLDLTRFHIDPLCVETAVNVYDCYQQPFAKLCFKQNLPS